MSFPDYEDFYQFLFRCKNEDESAKEIWSIENLNFC